MYEGAEKRLPFRRDLGFIAVCRTLESAIPVNEASALPARKQASGERAAYQVADSHSLIVVGRGSSMMTGKPMRPAESLETSQAGAKMIRLLTMKTRSPSSKSSDDPEAKQKPKESLEGYADFSKYISSDDELFVFRRFGALGARNLLYLQAELQMLEARLDQLDREDQKELDTLPEDRKKKIRYPAKSWESFQVEARQDGRQKRKMEILLRLRPLMKEYGMRNSSLALPA